jgi:NitT/TauT family transport system permease protein
VVRQVLGIALGAVAWEILGRAQVSILVPPVTSIAQSWWALLIEGRLLPALGVTLQAVLIGFGLALFVGVPLGLAMGRYQPIHWFFDLYVSALMATPHIALIPLILLWVGTGLEGRIVVVFLFTFIPLLVNTEAGVRSVDRSYVEMARTFGAGERQVMMKVVIPDALPLILAGVRLSLGRAVKGAITAEVILAAAGLGLLLLQYGHALAAAQIYAIIVTIVVIAMLLTEVFRIFERRILSWQGGIQV